MGVTAYHFFYSQAFYQGEEWHAPQHSWQDRLQSLDVKMRDSIQRFFTSSFVLMKDKVIVNVVLRDVVEPLSSCIHMLLVRDLSCVWIMCLTNTMQVSKCSPTNFVSLVVACLLHPLPFLR